MTGFFQRFKVYANEEGEAGLQGNQPQIAGWDSAPPPPFPGGEGLG